MSQQKTIAAMGIEKALELMLPHVRRAGQTAQRLQGQIKALDRREKGGSFFASAITDADVLLQDILGSAILNQFSDATFYGEEQDHISIYFPKEAPYRITLDPINGTAYYRDGLPQYEIILTICDAEWTMLGALIWRPAYDEGFLGFVDAEGEREAVHIPVLSEALEFGAYPLRLAFESAPKRVYLDAAYAHKADLVRAAGYEPIFPWRDYASQPDWPHASCDVLLGTCRGILNPRAQIIDAAAFGFIVECAGGFWLAGALDPETKRYRYGLSAIDPETAELLMDVRQGGED